MFFALVSFFGMIAIYFAAQPLLRIRRRAQLRQKPFPEEWLKIIANNVPVYEKMPSELRVQLQERMMVFLDEKEFIGMKGVEINDEIRVTIASQACMLLLNRESDYYAGLYRIIVYPSAYQHTQMEQNEHGVMEPKTVARLGESWTGGDVVLSWEHSKSGATNFFDGHNVVIHEFSHQLDQADGLADGVPTLGENSCYRTWAGVIHGGHRRLVQRSRKKRRRPVLRNYGATNQAEFFAVASEAFFEKPRQMKKKHPDLFQELKQYYQVDPEEWI
jgi:MtfA peptidase